MGNYVELSYEFYGGFLSHRGTPPQHPLSWHVHGEFFGEITIGSIGPYGSIWGFPLKKKVPPIAEWFMIEKSPI